MKSAKRNGCARPFHRLQLLSWLIVSLLSSLFYSLLASALTSTGWLALTALYSLCLGLCLLFGLLCTIRDPTDLAVRKLLSGGNSSGEFSSSLYPRLCTRCNTHVGSLSKHCNKCNRCTDRFDHHCDWLNNCIGGVNYRLFVLLLGSLEIWIGLELVVAGQVLVGIFMDMEPGSSLVRRFEVGDGGYCYIVVMMMMTVACILIFIGNGYLILFHGWLRCNGITTYDYIMERRKSRSQIKPAPDASGSMHKCENSSVIAELSLPGPAEERAECPFQQRDYHDASPSDDELKKMFSRTIDNSSLPSCDKPTDMDFQLGNKRRRAQESMFSSAEEISGSEHPTEQPQAPIRHRTGPLPDKSDFP